MVGIWVCSDLFHIGIVGLGFGPARLDVSTAATRSREGRGKLTE